MTWSWPQAITAVACIAGLAAVIVAATVRGREPVPSSCQGRARVTYTAPPAGYSPPTVCEACREPIRLTPILGGVVWLHTDPATGRGHQVVMRSAGWWDTRTGRIIHGTARLDEFTDSGPS